MLIIMKYRNIQHLLQAFLNFNLDDVRLRYFDMIRRNSHTC